MSVKVFSGVDVLDRLGPALDDLHASTVTPVTARRPWVSTWIRCTPDYEPLAIVIEGALERLEAAALLASKKRQVLTEFVALGHGPSDQVCLPARSLEAAAALGRAVAEYLRARSGHWRLVVRNLPSEDPVARKIADELGCAQVLPGDPSPALRFDAGRSLRSYVSRNHHQQVRRMVNRMSREGLVPVIGHLRDADEIRAILPELEAVCRQRDVELRGRSYLDGSEGEAFFRQVILEHAARGEVELTTLRLKDELAAFVLCFLDSGVYRMWNCRVSPEWSRYGAGRVANNAALERALADDAAVEFDWMRGEEPYKASMSNHVARAQDLLAWSSPALRAFLDGPRRLKTTVKRVVVENEWLRPAVAAGKRLQSAGRRRTRAAAMALRRLRG
jgi:CelD/BcsL family acetyltransferase involved in cellulose biosynthesis